MSQNKGGKSYDVQDLNVTGDSANAMPSVISHGQSPMRLPGQAGLLFDQLIANNLKAGEPKLEGGGGGMTGGGSAVTDPASWARAGAGDFMPTHSARDRLASGGKGGRK